MSIEHPGAWILDAHPEFQWDMNLEAAFRDGWRTIIIKVSEGPYRDGTKLRLPHLKEFVRRARSVGFRIGYYAYLVESFGPGAEKRHHKSGKANAENYLRTVESLPGGFDSVVPCADFEHYGNAPWLSPYNGTLETFGEFVLDRLGGVPYIIYSLESYWESGIPAGPIENYGTKLAWDSQLAEIRDVIPKPRAYYESMERWGWTTRNWGGVTPIWWQFAWAGHVGGVNMDVNASRQSEGEHRELFRRAA